MKAGKGVSAQIVFMAVVSAVLGYAVYKAGQASLRYGFESELKRVAAKQRDLNVLFEEMEKRPKDEVPVERRVGLALRSGELAGQLDALNAEVDRAAYLAIWPGLAVGAGYFVICLRIFLRALKKRRAAAFFLSPAAVAGAREILEGPFRVEEGHVALTRAFDAEDHASLEVLQLVTKGLFESRRDEVVLDVVAETRPFSQFIGVLVSFAMDCDEAGKKLTLRVAAGSRKPFELVGLDQLAKLEAVEPEQPS